MTNVIFTGEPSLALRLSAKCKTEWHIQSSAVRLVTDDGINIRRENRPNEVIDNIIYYADADDKSIEANNLALLHKLMNYIDCWPTPYFLFDCLNRHILLENLINHLLAEDRFIGSCGEWHFHSNRKEKITKILSNKDFVFKTSLQHRGINKFLVKENCAIPSWKGLATVEPYWEGESVRILITPETWQASKVVNPSSWIKNSPGGEEQPYKARLQLVNHAHKVAEFLCLDVCGVDYIVEPDGKFHLLEANQYPGLTGTFGEEFLLNKMLEMEL